MELISYSPLTPDQADHLAEKLDELLCEYQIYHRNVRKVHWDPQLRSFLDLSEKVGVLYDIGDENRHNLAEMILELGYTPSSDCEEQSALMYPRVKVLTEVRNFDDAIMGILASSQELLETVEDVFYIAAEYNEQYSMAFLQQLGQQLQFTMHVFTSVRLAMNN